MRGASNSTSIGSLAWVLFAVWPFLALNAEAIAQTRASPPRAEITEGCPGLVAARPPFAQSVSLRIAALERGQVRLTYIGHSTFLIESPQRVRIATDYNDFIHPPALPDIATMNHAHSSHYTDHPASGIKYILRGWAENQKPARVDMTYKDVRVRNVPTNIRTFDGGTEFHGNSIFIFEVGGFCIAHLGHLHHTLTKAQLDEIGRVDAVLVPVDGSYTLDLDGMIEVLRALKAPLLIPMHYFSPYTLERFLQRVRPDWDIEVADIPSLVMSKASLPAKPKVLVLPGH